MTQYNFQEKKYIFIKFYVVAHKIHGKINIWQKRKYIILLRIVIKIQVFLFPSPKY